MEAEKPEADTSKKPTIKKRLLETVSIHIGGYFQSFYVVRHQRLITIETCAISPERCATFALAILAGGTVASSLGFWISVCFNVVFGFMLWSRFHAVLRARSDWGRPIVFLGKKDDIPEGYSIASDRTPINPYLRTYSSAILGVSMVSVYVPLAAFAAFLGQGVVIISIQMFICLLAGSVGVLLDAKLVHYRLCPPVSP